jgi:hypothetical protein
MSEFSTTLFLIVVTLWVERKNLVNFYCEYYDNENVSIVINLSILTITLIIIPIIFMIEF